MHQIKELPKSINFADIHRLPDRSEYIDVDQQTKIVADITSGRNVLFMPTYLREISLQDSARLPLDAKGNPTAKCDICDKPHHTSGVYKIWLAGTLQDGSRANVIINGIRPFFEILVEHDNIYDMLTFVKEELASITDANVKKYVEMLSSHKAYDGIFEIVEGKPFIGYQQHVSKFIRIYFNDLKSRVAAINHFRTYKYDDGTHPRTAHDDISSYYRVVCRDNLTTFSSWVNLQNYTFVKSKNCAECVRIAKRNPGTKVAKGCFGNGITNNYCASHAACSDQVTFSVKGDIFFIHIDDYRPAVMKELVKDRTMYLGWDIETWSPSHALPLPENRDARMFCISMVFGWVNSPTPFAKFCLCDLPAATYDEIDLVYPVVSSAASPNNNNTHSKLHASHNEDSGEFIENDDVPTELLDEFEDPIPEPTADVIAQTDDKSPMVVFTTVQCTNELQLIEGFARIFELYQPELIIGFNDADYDWPWLVERAAQHNLLATVYNCMSSQFYYNNRSRSIQVDSESVFKYNYKRLTMKLDATTNMNGRVLDCPGYIPIDVRSVFRQLYVTSEESSLKFFLGINNLKSKDDMPIAKMFGIYEDYTKFIAERGAKCSNESNDPNNHNIELARRKYMQGMAEINKYCVVDAVRCHDLMYVRTIFMDKRELSHSTYVSLADSIFRANCMKVVNKTIGEGQQPPFNIRFSNINSNDDVTEDKYPGAFVFPPDKGLKISKLSVCERIERAKTIKESMRTQSDKDWINTTQEEIDLFHQFVQEYGATPSEEDLCQWPNFVRDVQEKQRVQSCTDTSHTSHTSTVQLNTMPAKFKEFLLEPTCYPTVALDFSSLYPSLIRCYNLSPEYFIQDTEVADVYKKRGVKIIDVSFNYSNKLRVGHFVWHNNKYEPNEPGFQFGIYPYILHKLFNERAQIKKQLKSMQLEHEKMALVPAEQRSEQHQNSMDDLQFKINYLNCKQSAIKVFMNTFYGAAGNPRSSFFIVELAGAITTYGKRNIQFAFDIVKEKGCHVYYGDSVSATTPVFIEQGGYCGYVPIEELFNRNWPPIMYSGANIGKSDVVFGPSVASASAVNATNVANAFNDASAVNAFNDASAIIDAREPASTTRGAKSQCKDFIETENLTTWTECGMSKVYRIIRHKVEKKMYRIYTSTSVIEVTEDHSLVDYRGNIIKPAESLNCYLLTSTPTPQKHKTYFHLEIMYVLGIYFEAGRTNKWCIELQRTPANRQICLDICDIMHRHCLVKFAITESETMYKVEPLEKYDMTYMNFVLGLYNGTYYIGEILISSPVEYKKEFLRGLSIFATSATPKDGPSFDHIEFHGISQGQIAGITRLMRSIGYRVYSGYSHDIKMYSTCGTREPFHHYYGDGNRMRNVELNRVTHIEEIKYCGYVYDLETANHHFHAGIGSIVVHNTDSLYLTMPRKDFAEVDKSFYSCNMTKSDYWTQLVNITFVGINKIRDIINAEFERDNGTRFLSMAYEEVIYPVAFNAKKKYFGIPHVTAVNFKPDELFVKGLEVKKRGVSNILRVIFNEIMWKCCSMDNYYTLLELIHLSIDHIYHTDWTTADFAQTAVWNPLKKNVKVVTFVDRMRKINVEIKPNERFRYVYVKKYPFVYDHAGRKQKIKAGDRMELESLTIQNKYAIDLDYYMESSLCGQFARLVTYHKMFEVEVVDDSITALEAAEKIVYSLAKKYVISHCSQHFDKYSDLGPVHKTIYKNVTNVMNHELRKCSAVLPSVLSIDTMNVDSLVKQIENDASVSFVQNNSYTMSVASKHDKHKAYYKYCDRTDKRIIIYPIKIVESLVEQKLLIDESINRTSIICSLLKLKDSVVKLVNDTELDNARRELSKWCYTLEEIAKLKDSSVQAVIDLVSKTTESHMAPSGGKPIDLVEVVGSIEEFNKTLSTVAAAQVTELFAAHKHTINMVHGAVLKYMAVYTTKLCIDSLVRFSERFRDELTRSVSVSQDAIRAEKDKLINL